MNKILVFLLSFMAGSLLLTSCGDWTETEPLTVVDPNIREQNPELYARYLEGLRNYRNSHHKVVYTWFDNSEKQPFSKAQHIDNIPDSIDVAVLMYPDDLTERELNEIDAIRRDKGIKVIFSLGYDAIKLNYDNMVAESQESGEGTPVPKDFISYLVDTLQYTLKLVDKYNYDGISIGYNGKSSLHMTEQEKKEYISNETAYIGIVTGWMNTHKNKSVVFEGKPQNLVDKTILNSCKHIIIPTADVKTGSMLTYNITMASVDGVPSDRFVVTVETASLDQTDNKTGYWANGTRAITSSAIWASATYPGFTIAGLGIYNVNNDYHNTRRVYDHTKKAIDTLNPSIKSK
ncbi:MAG: glycoside hydrolase family 18 [Prevotella sp.]|nr:glycoside hydrolase family 18 [Prevotella sp.]